jgi:hypothetical protein
VNEQRLAELEAMWPLDIPSPPNLPVTAKATVVIRELIAEIRGAWRERDQWKSEEWLTRKRNTILGGSFSWEWIRETALEMIEATAIARANFEGEFQRAARAEADVERLKTDNLGLQGAYSTCVHTNGELQAMWNTLADAAKDVLNADRLYDKVPLEKLVELEHAVYSEHHDTIKPAIMELERLRAVREAAEAVLASTVTMEEWWVRGEDSPKQRFKQTPEFGLAITNLHRAIDRAQKGEEA